MATCSSFCMTFLLAQTILCTCKISHLCLPVKQAIVCLACLCACKNSRANAKAEQKSLWDSQFSNQPKPNAFLTHNDLMAVHANTHPSVHPSIPARRLKSWPSPSWQEPSDFWEMPELPLCVFFFFPKSPFSRNDAPQLHILCHLQPQMEAATWPE